MAARPFSGRKRKAAPIGAMSAIPGLDALVSAPEKRGNKYNAVPTECRAGHLHDSKAEAKRCNELQLLERGGVISDLQQQPEFKFVINGKPVMMANNQQARLRADFSYIENGKRIVEDKKGMIVRDFPLRLAVARAIWPEIEWRVV